VLRVAQGRKLVPSAVILDSRTLQSSPESGQRAGYDGAKRKRLRSIAIRAALSLVRHARPSPLRDFYTEKETGEGGR
jgi:hypothetical protein